MNLTAEAKLRFDRRMRGRHGFITEEELNVELESLEDVGDKALGPDEDAQPTLKPVSEVAAPVEAAAPASAPEAFRAEPVADLGVPSDTPAAFRTQSFGGDPDETL
jgi:hypothetical protein